MKDLSKNPILVYGVLFALAMVLTLTLSMEIMSIIGAGAIGWHLSGLAKWILQR